MTISKINFSAGVLALTILFILAVPTFVSAQGAGVRISPAIIEETLEPGQLVTYEYEVENLNNVEQQYFLFTRNISGVSDGGAPIFAESNAETTGYALADWITLPVVMSCCRLASEERLSLL